MVLAAYRDTAYDIVLFLHILAVLVALAPAVVHPMVFGLEQRRADGDTPALASRVVGLPTTVYTWALVAAGILGIGMISMSDDVIGWGDTWIWLSIVLWVVLNGVLHGLLFPAERALAGGDLAAGDRLNRIGPLAIVLALILLYLMVFKPGGGGL